MLVKKNFRVKVRVQTWVQSLKNNKFDPSLFIVFHFYVQSGPVITILL